MVSVPAEDALPVRPWLDHLVRHLPVAEKGADPEGVHQVRVAAARLRVWLKLGRRRMLDDDLCWLRRAAGEVRDLDVALALGGPDLFLAELRRRWMVAHARLVRDLSRPRVRGLLAALAASPPVRRADAEDRARLWRRKARALGDALDWEEGPDEDVHAFRRRMRRLRYTLEWLGEPSKPIKKFADDLGELNDLAVLRQRLAAGEWVGPETPPLQDLDHRIASTRATAAERWPELRGELRPTG